MKNENASLYFVDSHKTNDKTAFIECSEKKRTLSYSSLYNQSSKINDLLIKNNIQSTARQIRYKLLSNFCLQKKVKTILTAHNLEDQVETFFIRLSRGSGLQGLSSMKQVNKISGNISLIRPLLDFKKNQLIKNRLRAILYFIKSTLL